jgi:hypothetical protein
MFMDVVSVGEGSDEEIVTDASVFGAANDQTGREMGGGGGIGVATTNNCHGRAQGTQMMKPNHPNMVEDDDCTSVQCYQHSTCMRSVVPSSSSRNLVFALTSSS